LKIIKTEELVTPELTMGGEDVAFYLEKVKGCFIFLGSGIGNNPTPLHNAQYSIPEEVMIEGIKLNCQIAFDLLAG
jgi:metal-dependent amidase/aminoacylase/carboxypeptidase family protein